MDNNNQNQPPQPTWPPEANPPQNPAPQDPAAFTPASPEPVIPVNNPIPQSLDPIAPINGTPPPAAPDSNTNPFLNSPPTAPSLPQNPFPPVETPSQQPEQPQTPLNTFLPEIHDQTIPPNPPLNQNSSSSIQDLSQLTFTSLNSSPSPNPTPQIPVTNPSPPTQPVDTAPTDLSHLIGTQEDQTTPPGMYSPPATQTGEGSGSIVPPTPVPATQPGTHPAEAVATGSHFNPTKILIIVGVVVLLLVSGLSAYFFFGPGRQAPVPSSLPAQADQAPLTNPPKAIESTQEPTLAPQPTASSSASTTFGGISSESTGSAKSGGSSAINLLKNRQSPTPKP